MASCFKILILIWVLQLTAGKVTDNTTGGQMTTQKASSPFLNHTITPSVTAIADATVEPTQVQTKPSETPNNKQAAPTHSISTQLSMSSVSMNPTTEKTKARTTATTAGTTPASNPTTSTIVISRNSTQGQNIAETTTFFITTDKMTQISTGQEQTTEPLFTTTISNSPTDSKSSSCVTTMGKKPTNANIKTTTNSQVTSGKSNEGTNHGKVVAGLIGGALTVMMLGFLIIFIKKQRLQKQQITTTDWAGPSPFLEGAVENGMTARRSSNRISLSSFLPHRLSKRLSLLPETDEELQEIAKGTTFGDKHKGITFGQEVHSNDMQESKGAAAILSENNDTRDAPETNENSVSVSSSQTNNTIPTDDLEVVDLHQDSLSTISLQLENPSVQLNGDLNSNSKMSVGL